MYVLCEDMYDSLREGEEREREREGGRERKIEREGRCVT